MNFRLRNLRQEQNLTAKEIASKLNCSQSLVYEWEKGRSEPSVNALMLLSDIFDCSIDYLVGREDDFGVINQTGNSLTSIQQELLFSFNLLDRDKQQQVIGFCKALNY
ncbi:MAG: helix-turn-helix transcriptional regulator [Clostridia bacterium]|nr:helix-turn-helix transcriptional regulator [Clostridia bacterium]